MRLVLLSDLGITIFNARHSMLLVVYGVLQSLELSHVDT